MPFDPAARRRDTFTRSSATTRQPLVGQVLPCCCRGASIAMAQWGTAMDGIALSDLILFVAAAFAASLVAGLAGFAFGLVAAALWLHILGPAQSAALIVAFGLLVQGFSVWKLRRAVKACRLLPFIVGGAIGVPLGAELLRWLTRAEVTGAVGVVLILFSLYGLAQPKLAAVRAGGQALDGVIGVASGLLGGATGLGGILTTLWCGVRGWSKDEQRAVFQPVAVAIFAMTALWFGGLGLVGGDTLRLFLIGVPAVLAGTWVGLRLYGRLDEAAFRKTVLALLLVSGVTLVL
jgi:uncharacterized membrane protein YfcA